MDEIAPLPSDADAGPPGRSPPPAPRQGSEPPPPPPLEPPPPASDFEEGEAEADPAAGTAGAAGTTGAAGTAGAAGTTGALAPDGAADARPDAGSQGAEARPLPDAAAAPAAARAPAASASAVAAGASDAGAGSSAGGGAGAPDASAAAGAAPEPASEPALEGAPAPRRGRVRPALAHVAMLTCVLACTTLLGERAVRTPDAYFHLHLGREILRDRAVPRANHYLATNRGAPFIDVEWGFQAAVAWLDGRYGLEGPIQLRNALALAATLLVYGLTAVRAGGGALAGGAGAAAFLLVASPRFLLAPEVLSIALLALTAALLEARHRFRRAPLALPALGLVWANCHGFWVLLPVLATIAAVVDLARGRGARLAVVAAATLAAGLANPYGADGFLYPFRLALDAEGRALLAEVVVELGSPLSDPQLRRIFAVRAGLALAALTAVGAGGLARRERDPERLVVGALALALGLGYVRNLGFFAALGAPLAVPGLAALAGGLAPRLAARGGRSFAGVLPALRGAATALCGFLLLYAAWFVGSERGEPQRLEGVGQGARMAAAIDHDAAIDFCLEHVRGGFPTAVWNDFSTGHALLERSGGLLRPMLCGQTDLSRPLLGVYARAVQGRAGLADLLEAAPADAFFVDHRRLAGSPLLAELVSAESGFALVYLDGRDAVFLRRSDRLRALVQSVAVDLGELARDPEAGLRFADEEDASGAARPWVEALRRQGVLGRPQRLPRDRLEAARFLLAAGYPQGALRLAEGAERLAPGWPPIDFVIGLAARELGDLDRAKERLRRAAQRLADAAEPYHALALVHLRLGELGRAEEALARAVDLDAGNPVYRQNLRLLRTLQGRGDAVASAGADEPDAGSGSADGSASTAGDADQLRAVELFNQAAALAGEGQSREAERLYRRAVRLAPGFADAHYNLGNLYFRGRRFDEAALAYQAAVGLAPRDVAARYNLALALVELGRPEEALRELEALLAHEPGHAAARRLAARLAQRP